MPRTVQITTPPAETQGLVDAIGGIEGLISLRVFPGVSAKPPGDVIDLEVTDASIHRLMRLLDERGVGHNDETSITTSTPESVVSQSSAGAIANDRSEWTWEEMEVAIARESNMTANGLASMVAAGMIAATGVATGAIHLVIGAMVIAPGFEPLTRISLGWVAGSPAWRRGLRHAAMAYLALVVGAVAATLVLRAAGYPGLGGHETYHPSDSLVSYWTTISAAGLLASAAASVAGAVLIAAGRALLTGGVMVALALVPTATVAGMGLVLGEWGQSGAAALRWLLDVVIVLAGSALVLGWKRVTLHRRRSML